MSVLPRGAHLVDAEPCSGVEPDSGKVHIWCDMPRKPNHRLSDAERYKGQIASRASAHQNATTRRTGWLIDAADYILAWRLEGNEGDPPVSALRRFLADRGWTSERGKKVSRAEVDRMLESIDPAKSGIPRNKGEWEAFGVLCPAGGRP